MAEKTIAMPNQDGGTGHETTRANEDYVKPPVDIYESPEGLTVLADLPGVKKDDLSIEVEDNILTIQARARHEMEGEPIYREFALVNFFRQFQLSNQVDTAKIAAEFRHGVLKLTLPKAEQAKPKQIQVQVG
jgi:HSP20 family protein